MTVLAVELARVILSSRLAGRFRLCIEDVVGMRGKEGIGTSREPDAFAIAGEDAAATELVRSSRA